MPSIQVKDVPDDVHAVLRRRAAMAGQSLQEYLLGRLRAEAATPTLEEVFAGIDGRGTRGSPFTADDVLAALHAEREARDGR